jgi:hypothetical protein
MMKSHFKKLIFLEPVDKFYTKGEASLIISNYRQDIPSKTKPVSETHKYFHPLARGKYKYFQCVPRRILHVFFFREM